MMNISFSLVQRLRSENDIFFGVASPKKPKEDK